MINYAGYAGLSIKIILIVPKHHSSTFVLTYSPKHTFWTNLAVYRNLIKQNRRIQSAEKQRLFHARKLPMMGEEWFVRTSYSYK